MGISSRNIAGTLAAASVLGEARASRWQDPDFINMVAPLWARLQEVDRQRIAATQDDADQEIPPADPLLASAPTGNVNALAFVDRHGRTAIVFEEEILTFGTALALSLASVVIESRNGQQYWLTDTADIRRRLREQPWLRRGIASFFNSLAANGTPRVPDEIYLRSVMKPFVWRTTAYLEHGFRMFLLGHEYCHLKHRHHEQLLGVWKGPVIVLSDVKRGEALDAYFEHYYERFPVPDKEKVQNFAVRQVMEFMADCEGYVLTTLAARSFAESQALSPSGHSNAISPQFFVVVGGLLFFWGVEFLERAVRLRMTGSDGRDDPILTRDLGAQNLLLRRTHPCPLSRLDFVLEYIGNRSIPEFVGLLREFSAVINAVFQENPGMPTIRISDRELRGRMRCIRNGAACTVKYLEQ